MADMSPELSFQVLICVRGMANDLIELRRETRQVAAEIRTLLEECRALRRETAEALLDISDIRLELVAAHSELREVLQDMKCLYFGSERKQESGLAAAACGDPTNPMKDQQFINRTVPAMEIPRGNLVPAPVVPSVQDTAVDSKTTRISNHDPAPATRSPELDPPNKWINLSTTLRPPSSQKKPWISRTAPDCSRTLSTSTEQGQIPTVSPAPNSVPLLSGASTSESPGEIDTTGPWSLLMSDEEESDSGDMSYKRQRRTQ